MEIAEELGCSPTTIYERLKEFRIPIEKNKKISNKNKENMRKLWKDEDYCLMQSKSHKEKWQDKKYRQRMSEAHKGNSGYWTGKIRFDLKLRWRDPEWRANTIRNLLKTSARLPTKPEKRFIEICKKYNLPFKYVGNGKLIVGGLNPDFVISKKRRVLVEVLGRYWHSERVERFTQKPEVRVAIYSKFGWKCILVWEDELSNLPLVLNRVRRYSDENLSHNS